MVSGSLGHRSPLVLACSLLLMLTSRYPSGRCISTAVGPGHHAQHIYVCIVPDVRCKAHGTSLNYISPAATEKKKRSNICHAGGFKRFGKCACALLLKMGNFNVLMRSMFILNLFSHIGLRGVSTLSLI